MPCLTPRILFPPRPGARKKAWRDSPYFQGQKGREIPCGQCIDCRLGKSGEWGLRLMCEAQMHRRDGLPNAWMGTLTYAPEHLPRTAEFVGGELVKRDVQLFMKRFREECDQKLPVIDPETGRQAINRTTGKPKTWSGIRYFLCGEYADSEEHTQRAHYHVIIFGYTFPDMVRIEDAKSGGVQFESASLTRLWGMGRATLVPLTQESADYVARYTLKKLTGPMADAEYSRPNLLTGEIVQVQKPFLLMSTHPGIGAEWYRQFKGDAFPSGFMLNTDRQKRPVPRYFKRKFGEETQARTDAAGRLLNLEKFRFDQKMTAAAEKFRADHAEDFTPERIRDRAEFREVMRKSLGRRSL